MYKRVAIDLPEYMLEIIENEAKKQRRSRKAELEMIIIEAIENRYVHMPSIQNAQEQPIQEDDNPFD